jgi:hypothetical protein
MWSIVADAAVHLGGAALGVDALAQLPGGEAAAREEPVGA